MKTIFLWLFVVILYSATSNVSAQVVATEVIYAENGKALASVNSDKLLREKDIGNTEKESVESTKEKLKAEKANFAALKANARAQKFFSDEFKDASNVQWVVGSEAISAFHIADNVQIRVIFDKKGHWIHTIKSYTSDKIPADIKEIVEKVYPGFIARSAQEIKEGDITFHMVQLESLKGYKIVAVNDGEIIPYQDLSKE